MKKKCIIITCLIAICLCSSIYIKALFDKYPQIEISKEMLYGENNSNLKDFMLNGDGLISVSNDPWIEYSLDKSTKVKVMELDISEVTQEGQWGEVFNTDTWESNVFSLKNGKIMLYYDEVADLENLRFDLVAYQSVHLKIDQVKINSEWGLVRFAIEKIVLISAFILLMGMLVFMYLQFIRKRNKKIQNIEAAFLVIIPAVLAGLFVYNIVIYQIDKTLITWLLILLFSLMILFISCLYMTRKKIVFAYVEIFLFTLINWGIVETISGMEFNFKHLADGMWNLILVLFLVMILYLVFGNMKWSMIVTNMACVVLGIVNHYFYLFRGNPLELSDILVAETAVSVLGNYEFKINNSLLYCIVLEVGIICYFRIYKNYQKRKKEIQTVVVVTLLLFMGIIANEPGVSYWNMVADTKATGYINAFVAYGRHDLKSTKPDGYSDKKVEEILGRYEEPDTSRLTDADKPNIIVIMNEAFSDLPTQYGFDTKMDGMPFIHSLEENTVKGKMMVSVFGGGTANTEYEFLTGNSIAFFNTGSAPYVQNVKRTQESLAWELKDMGYQTIAFHPYEPGNYQRDKVYPRLGFDTFVSIQDDLKYTDRLRAYMSDESDIKNLIDIYEQNSENGPVFLFNVTMQNHGDYNRTESELEATIKPSDSNLQQYTQLLEYLALIKETDAAFKELVTYFEGVDKDTIILMYGDHQPGLDSEIYEALVGTSSEESEERALEKAQQMHTVPFVLWANFDISEDTDILTSPNYLREILLNKAGLPLSRYEQFQSECASIYPAINSLGYYDLDGKLYPMDDEVDQIDLLYQYQILQYANVFDKSEMQNFE